MIYIKRFFFLFYARIAYQFKTSELKNVENLVEQIRRECAFSYNLSHYIPGRWSLKIECGP